MIALIVGFGNLGIGAAYCGLGLLSAWETLRLHSYRGWSRFGLGFSLMAASCGPHHLVHGWQALASGAADAPTLAATLIGLPGGLIFVWLRLEAMAGGRGERWFAASPQGAVLLAGAFVVTMGWLAATAFAGFGQDSAYQFVCTSAGVAARGLTTLNLASLTFATNAFVTVTYAMVGWYLADRQLRRYLADHVWSLSGVALSGVFFTCAQMHVVDAFEGGSYPMLAFDLLGVPASIYFLRIVKQLHNDSVMDWNRRPLVGAAAAPPRPSPWSPSGAQYG